MRAIMYVAHGSRLPEKNREFRCFVEQIMQQRPETHQKIAFLEKEDETMALVGETLMEAGASEITVIPMLLFPAMHATKDIPEQVIALKKSSSRCDFPNCRYIWSRRGNDCCCRITNQSSKSSKKRSDSRHRSRQRNLSRTANPDAARRRET